MFTSDNELRKEKRNNAIMSIYNSTFLFLQIISKNSMFTLGLNINVIVFNEFEFKFFF